MRLRQIHPIFAFLLGFVILSCFLEIYMYSGLVLWMGWPSDKIQAGQKSRPPTHRMFQASSGQQTSNSRTQLPNGLQKMNLHPSVAPCEGGTPEPNLVFIKTHKTGSTTLSHIINRFGYTRKLSFALNKRQTNGHLGYINLSTTTPEEIFLPPIGVSNLSRTFMYNLMTGHARYDRAKMDAFMTSPTHYVTILRDPGHQFESAFSHFQFDDAFLSKMERKRYKTIPAKLEHFMEKPEFYQDRLKHLSWEKQKGLRWYYAKNNQIFDMGLDHEHHEDDDIVSAYIDKLEAELDLVLITEYYDESLLLLKSCLCWDTADILYVSKNMRPPPTPVSESLRKKLRQWNSVDVKLYKHFNNSLWNKIREYGPNFQTDLAKFREHLKEVFDECVGDLKVSKQGRFKYSNYKVKAGSGVNCTLIAESKSALFSSIWQRQSQQTDTLVKGGNTQLSLNNSL
ncbi:galactose-3-O-sulfotransferase 2-like [Asterias rubens]|uniref:galactose-3-O-sulfotransferase 2-like n=1 Tax=Asterias rubens TaxID=7604 RepID=UPI0014557D51|nr:galactose-3-O-sulfotransferase 2-like [Asterias rubens]